MRTTLAAGIASTALLFTTSGTAYAQTISDIEAMDLGGQTINIFGPWVGEAEQEAIGAVIARFNEATGANAEYAGSDSLEQQIVIDTEAGSPPDVTFFPQPGLAANLAAKGFLVPLPEGSQQWVEENYAAGSS